LWTTSSTPAGRVTRRSITRRRVMPFSETIGQHFRHTQISPHFPTHARAEPHDMGAGAIDVRAIEILSTGMERSARARCGSIRRRAVVQSGAYVRSPTGDRAHTTRASDGHRRGGEGLGAVDSPPSGCY
jgi:hypothetical protein